MRKKTTEPTEPLERPAAEPKASKPEVSGRNWRPLIIMGAIMFLAAFLRVAFSFSVSAGSDFALSGGTEASNNLRFVQSVVSDGKLIFSDDWMSYPEGSILVVPVLFSCIMSAFAVIMNAIIGDAALSSSAVLAASGPVFAVLSCIPMYFVGKVMFNSKLAGYAAAAFLALCPVYIQESVFSNGTGMSFAVFFFLFGVYYLIKALKGLNEPVSAYKTSMLAGLAIALAMLSFTDFRQVAIPLVIAMIAQVLVDRFKGKDPRPASTVYSMVLAIGFVIPCAVYAVVGYWDALVSGVLFFVALAIGFTTAYSWTYKKPWLLTLPIISIVCIAILVVLSFVAPSFYADVVSGNSPLSPDYAALLGKQYLTLSQLTSFYGVITYWFVFLLCLYMAFRYLKNASSALYTFTLVWLFTMTLTLGHNAMQAAFCAPVFALGFAAVIKALLEHVNFKAYFAGIKTGAGAKTKLKRLVSPIPLMSILVAILLVAGPNMMQAVDAGISSNDVSDYNEKIEPIIGNDQFGSLGYYIKTDDTWNVKDAFKSVKGADGAVVTWMSYSNDAQIYAGMKSFTDIYGNGAVTASNILLANAVNGSSAAALLLSSIIDAGMTEDVKSKLTAAGFSAEDVALIDSVLSDACYKAEGWELSVRDQVLSDYDTYGAVDSGITDENVKYLWLTNYIAVNYHSYDITSAYDALGYKTPYIMVTGDMMPFYYGYATVFEEMAMMNGYAVNMSYGSVNKFTTFNYSSIYGFTEAMYDTMMYRAYIGMTPSEAGYSSIGAYLSALSAANSSLVMHPGYGLSNYNVAYWQVMYNPSNSASPSDDGWVQMNATDAIAKQSTNGGLINYVSGLPIILNYMPNSVGHLVSGKVTDSASAGVADIRVSAIDSDGVVRATTHTGTDGTYKLCVPTMGTTKLVFWAGAGTASNGGVIVGEMPAAATADLSGVVTEVDTSLELDDGASGIPLFDGSDVLLYTVTIANSAAGTSDTYKEGEPITGQKFTVGLGSQTITVSDGDTTIATATIIVNEETSCLKVPVTVYDYTININDVFGTPITDGKSVKLTGPYKELASQMTADGKVTFKKVPAGTYDVEVDGYYVDSSKISISSSSESTITISKRADFTVTVPSAGTVFVYGDAYSTSKVADSTTVTISLPVSEISDSRYTMYMIVGSKIWYAVADSSSPSVTLVENDLATVTGVLNNPSGDAVSGDLYFIYGDAKFRATADSEGKYKAYVPAGEATVYATDSSNAFFGKMSFTAGANTDQAVGLVAADRVSSGDKLIWSNVTFSYDMLKVTSGALSMDIMINKGAFTFYLPREMGATLAMNLTGNLVLKDALADIPADHQDAQTRALTLALGDSATKTLTVVNDLGLAGTVDLRIESDTKDLSDWATQTFEVKNSVTVRLGSSSEAVYFNGSHRFNPMTLTGTSINLSDLVNGTALTDMTYDLVTITGMTSDYTAIVYYNDADYSKTVSVYSSTAKQIQAHPATLTDYTLVIYNKEGTKVLYQSAAAGDITANVADCVDAVKVTGFVGASISGCYIIFDDGVKVPVKVTDGLYTAYLKKGTNYTVDLQYKESVKSGSNVKYVVDHTVHADSVSFTENATKNFVCTSVPYVESIDLSGLPADDNTVKHVTFTIPAGAIENTSDGSKSYSFGVGAGWESYEFKIGTNTVNGFVLAEGVSSPIVYFSGYYNSSLYRLGTDALSISFNDGSDVVKGIGFTGYSGTAGQVLVNRVDDTLTDHTYEYSYDIINLGSSDVTVAVDLTGTTYDGWTVMFKTETYLGTTVDAVAADFTAIPGTTKFSVVMTPVDTQTEVPALKIAFSAANIGTSTPDDITVTEGKATSEASPISVEVSVTDMSADGRGVVNDQGKIPVIVWVMVAAMALLLILIFWMASKRGVFTRRK